MNYAWNVFIQNNEPWCEEKQFTFTREWLEKNSHHKEWRLLRQWDIPRELLYFNKIPYGLFHILTQLNCENKFYKIFNQLIPIDKKDVEIEIKRFKLYFYI